MHFDLQTQNIIHWNSATDRRFSTQLERRLRYVLRPLLKAQAETEQRVAEENTFSSLSVNTRRRRVIEHAIKEGKKLHFRGSREDADFDDARFMPKWFYVALYAARLEHNQSRSLNSVLVLALPKLTKTAIGQIANRLARPIDEAEVTRARKKGKRVVDHVILISFASLAENLIGETLHSFERRDVGAKLAWCREITDFGANVSGKRKIWLHPISNIRSETQAREQIRQVLAQVPTYH